MIQCYITHLKEGILSGGGIGDVIGQKKWKDDLGLFFSRWFLDMIFFIINILLVLNMINGIVVNAFADMREKDDVLNRESTEKCFICSIERSEFKKNNLSFSQHKAKDHNVMNYLNYLIKIRMTPDKDLDFFDEYIKKRIYLKDIKVFPNKETLSLGKEKS